MAYNPQMEQLKALQALTQQIAGQYGGGNDVQSVKVQNKAAVEGLRAQGMTDAQIAQTLPQLPWNDQSRAIPAQMPMVAPQEPQAPVQAPVAAPQMPVQAPVAAQPEATQAEPSFFQKLGQGFDRAATAGVIDPTTLTKDQRRILRGQLLMNIGGALSQNRPIGEGFQQQYNMLTKRQADEQAKQIEATRKSILSGADISTKEGVMAILPKLAQAGLQDDLFKFADYAQTAFPNQFVVQQNNQGMWVINKDEQPFNPDGSFNPNFAILIPGTTPQPEGMSMYDAARIDLQRRELALKEEAARTKAEAPKAFRPMSQATQANAEKMGTTRSQVLNAGAGFKPEYAGYKLGGETLMQAATIMPWNEEAKDAANWWAEYGRYKIVVRNEQFGATLTDNEKKDWDSVDINPNMKPEIVQARLRKQQQILDGAISRKALGMLSEGYNPESVSYATGLDFTGYENPGYPQDIWNNWTVEQRQQKQKEYWKSKAGVDQSQKPKPSQSAKPAPSKKSNDDALVNKYLQ